MPLQPQQMLPSWHTAAAMPVPTAPHQQVVAAPPATTVSNKKKLANDPNRPKRPTSAYFYFVQLQREEAAKRGEKITRVSRVYSIIISLMWDLNTHLDGLDSAF